MSAPTVTRPELEVQLAPAEPSIEVVPAAVMRGFAAQARDRAGVRSWQLSDVDWDQLRPEQLSDRDASVVRFITFIEDHIPGYLGFFLTAFPVAGQQVSPDVTASNREYFRFLISWAHDEERHASALTEYQIRAGLATEADLVDQLAVEGQKPFVLPYAHPLEAFTYTLVQEKATQLFYQRFAATVDEPILADLLGRLARDEARHFAFYANLVSSLLQTAPRTALMQMRDVIATFRMPLADTLAGYWRWSLEVADSAAYDHTEAYEAVTRIVRGFAEVRGLPEAADLLALVDGIRKVA